MTQQPPGARELKPCPHCGGLDIETTLRPAGKYESHGFAFVANTRCIDCHRSALSDEAESAIKLSIQEWNRRAEPRATGRGE